MIFKDTFNKKKPRQNIYDNQLYTGGNYDVSGLEIGIPQNITSTVTSLKMDVYNQLIEYLKK